MLHVRGYNFFNIPQLTLMEIEVLIKQHNDDIRQKKRAAQKNKAKRKRGRRR